MLPDPHGANKAQLLMIRLARNSGEHDSPLSIADWASLQVEVAVQGYRRWALTMDDDSVLTINPIPATYAFEWVYALVEDPATDSVVLVQGGYTIDLLHDACARMLLAQGLKGMTSVDEFKSLL